MAVVKPFRGLRFDPARAGRMEDVVSPPYDVIDAAAEAELTEKNPYNMVRLDLTKDVAGGGEDAGRYRTVRDRLAKWRADGALTLEERPCLYVYDIDYRHPSGASLKRRGLVALVRLAEFSEGVVKPHEQTFREVVGDRLRLLDACRTQFSQVFSLFSDPEGRVMAALDRGRESEPLYRVEDRDGCVHSLYRVDDQDAITAAVRVFDPLSLYIADGHHRYTTALAFRDLIAEREGGLDDDSPYNHIMMYLCPMEDEGLSVLPTHRLVRMDHVPAADLAARLGRVAEVVEVSGGSRESLVAEALAQMEDLPGDDHRFGMYHPDEDRCFLVRVARERAAEMLVDAAGPLRDLDVVVFSDAVLAAGLGLDRERCEQDGLISYHSDPDAGLDQAVKETVEGGGLSLLFLLRSTPVAQVCRVADAGLVMPHKSTYFYPKILTGLVMNPFEG